MKKLFLVIIILSIAFNGYCAFEKEVQEILTILPDGQIQVLEQTTVKEDGVTIGTSNHRKVIAPIDDVTKESKRIKDLTAALYTKDVVDAYKEKIAINNIIE